MVSGVRSFSSHSSRSDGVPHSNQLPSMLALFVRSVRVWLIRFLPILGLLFVSRIALVSREWRPALKSSGSDSHDQPAHVAGRDEPNPSKSEHERSAFACEQSSSIEPYLYNLSPVSVCRFISRPIHEPTQTSWHHRGNLLQSF